MYTPRLIYLLNLSFRKFLRSITTNRPSALGITKNRSPVVACALLAFLIASLSSSDALNFLSTFIIQ